MFRSIVRNQGAAVGTSAVTAAASGHSVFDAFGTTGSEDRASAGGMGRTSSSQDTPKMAAPAESFETTPVVPQRQASASGSETAYSATQWRALLPDTHSQAAIRRWRAADLINVPGVRHASSRSTANTDGSTTGPSPKKGMEFATGDIETPLAHGRGLKHHRLSRLTLSSEKQAEAYAQATGLEHVGTRFGTRMYQSRRGSVSAMRRNQEGRIRVIRVSSYATSKMLDSLDEVDAWRAYRRTGTDMGRQARDKGTKSTANAVVADTMTLRTNRAGDFVVKDMAHAQGVSGTAFDASTSAGSDLYSKAKAAARSAGKKNPDDPRATHHSEPMSEALLDSVLGSGQKRRQGAITMAASIPNQVCRGCSSTYLEDRGDSSIVATSAGRAFQGIPAGIEKPAGREKDPKAAMVTRAKPMTELLPQAANRREVLAIHRIHKARKSPKTALANTTTPIGGL